MRSLWSDAGAREFLERHAARHGPELALRTYTARLLGAEPGLVLHGGGNTSVKHDFVDRLGDATRALYVKASGRDLALAQPADHVPLDLARVRALLGLERLDDPALAEELRVRALVATAATPSIESPVHAAIPGRFVDHTHPGAVLALTNQARGEQLVAEALGSDVLVLPYVEPGLALARAVARALEGAAGARAMVWMQHGLVTWGDGARESYETTIELVTRAERFLAARAPVVRGAADPAAAERRLRGVLPETRGLLSPETGDPDRPRRSMIVVPLCDAGVLAFLDAPDARGLALAPPLTADHLIRTKPWPLWIDAPEWDDAPTLRRQLADGVAAFAQRYAEYVRRHGAAPADPLPRVVLLPGGGALCAGEDIRAATIARDITAETLRVKGAAAALGEYRGLAEDQLFAMEHRPLQQAKLAAAGEAPLRGHVALVTGAAGAIGSEIAAALLEQGCHVAATDLAGARLDALRGELVAAHGARVLAAALDVTDPASIDAALDLVTATWGGLDLLVINAGLAHVSSLAEMRLDEFRQLERVNVEGTLLLLGAAARLWERQATGGDAVLVSTKNVFAPGAQFGAYSATKAAAHQLARIASIELAPLGVRVNMVAPDAVFAAGSRRSGLWAAVGPARMAARGMSEEQLEEYYRSRNLLKVRVTARHVARAVLFFATRRTPTTGATLPVDGGLPDSTPR
ncbi:MAG: bifunctional aldolase/short-chain dehydrogenase [Acidobacteria bacterium]|nr:bifunctional aldolase/short-chain dehydrogenase [Acidobacteriota bacterium]